MTKQKRIAAMILAAAAVVVLLASSVFIIGHADHDCIGEDCPICEQLDACAQTLKQLFTVLAAAAFVLTLTFALRCEISRSVPVLLPRTPVYLKVKLSN